MNEHETPTPPDVAPALPCVICGTDLSLAHPDAWCPTCRAPVVRSEPGDPLDHSDLEHVRGLWRGWTIIVAQIALAFVMFGVVFYLEFTGSLTLAAEQALTVVSLAVMLVSLLGWWWFSQPEERIEGPHDGSVYRTWLRASLLIYALLSVPATVLEVFIFPASIYQPTTSPMWLTLLVLILNVTAGLASLSFMFASLRYIRWIAPRMRSSTAHRFASRAFKYLTWSIPCLLLTIVLAFIAGISGHPAAILLAILPGLVCLGLFLAAGLYNLVLIFVVWRRLNAIYKTKLDEQLSPTVA